jgi:hypothetical protein
VTEGTKAAWKSTFEGRPFRHDERLRDTRFRDRYERCECGRWKMTARQSRRWMGWCWCERYLRGHGPKVWRPLWDRLDLRCMGWYDCIDTQMVLDGSVTDYPRWVRVFFGISREAATS